jgi:hypothetical protein
MREPGELRAEGALSNRMPVIDVRMLERRAKRAVMTALIVSNSCSVPYISVLL